VKHLDLTQRRGVKKNYPHATTLRRNERTRIFLRIIETSRGGVAALREKFRPYVAA